MIIVIEGTDGSGKQTQAKLLLNYFKENGREVKEQSFPNYDSESSILVKKYLNGDFGGLNDLDAKQSSVLFSVDRLCTMQKYKDFLKKRGILLLDRYVSSNILHQASKIDDEKEQEEFVSWLENFEYNDLKLPYPDVTIFLDMRPDLSNKLRLERGELKAGTKKDIHESNLEYMKKCYDVGVSIAHKKSWQIVKCYEGNRIKTIEEIHNEIISVLKKLKY